MLGRFYLGGPVLSLLSHYYYAIVTDFIARSREGQGVGFFGKRLSLYGCDFGQLSPRTVEVNKSVGGKKRE